MRRLIIGPIPKNFNPKNDIPLSPICFIHNEDVVNDWEELEFPPDPFSDIALLSEAEKKTDIYVFSIINKVIKELNRKNCTNYSKKFWEILILPFLYMFVHIVYEKQIRIEQMIDIHGDENIMVRLLPSNENWNFKDTNDFVQNGALNPIFSHWIFSRILEELKPVKWKIEYCSAKSLKKSQRHQSERKYSNIKEYILSKMKFNRCGLSNGISVLETIFWTIYLSIKPIRKTKERDDDYANFKINFKNIFNFNFIPLLYKCLPKCFSNLKSIEIPNVKPIAGRIRLVGNSLYYNDDLKYFYAKCIEGKEKLISTQHGGGGCYYRILPHRKKIEHSQYRYFSWGWKKQNNYKGNILPMPSPLLSKYRDKHKALNKKLIFVGTVAQILFHRLASEPQPKQYISYRKEKIEFLKSLKNEIYTSTLYRPYLKELGSLKDYEYVIEKMPDIKICEKSFHDELLKCKILIIDHPGTTLSIAMAANIPTVCFWNMDHWPMSKQAQPIFEEMKILGILYNSGKEAATKINSIWEEVQMWWEGKHIQKIRKQFCDKYALSDRYWRYIWIKNLWKL